MTAVARDEFGGLINMDPYVSYGDFTTGNFANENDAKARLDEVILSSGMFHLYTERPGYFVQVRPGQQIKDFAIDRIITPTQALIANGWVHGAIGIECKQSGNTVGPPISQMLDYMRSAFVMPDGRMIMLSMLLLWPWSGTNGPLRSVVTQQRLGWADERAGALRLSSGLEFCSISTSDGTVTLSNTDAIVRQGRKAGSR